MSQAAALTTKKEQTDAAELDHQLGQHVAAAQQRMARAVLVGKLQNDPLADLVDAMAQALGVQHEIHRASVHQQREATVQLEQQLRAAIEAMTTVRQLCARTSLTARRSAPVAAASLEPDEGSRVDRPLRRPGSI